MKNEKIIYKIDQKYGSLFKKICYQAVSFFDGVPIETEDLYYSFLIKIPELIKNFDLKFGVPLKTYLGKHCKYHSMNMCRTFSTKKHMIMNNRYDIDKFQPRSVSDSFIKDKPFDISILSDMERKIYFDYFLKDKTVAYINKHTQLSRYKIGVIIKTVKVKLIDHFKN